MNWIGIFISLLKVLTVLVSILIVFTVLLQRPKNEGLGAAFGGDTASNIFGAQTTNVLATLTRWLGGIFLALCLLIAILGSVDPTRKSIVNAAIEKSKQERIAREKQEADKKAAEDAANKVKADAANAAAAKDAMKLTPPAADEKKEAAPVPAVQPKPEPGPAPVPAPAPEPAKPAEGDKKPE